MNRAAKSKQHPNGGASITAMVEMETAAKPVSYTGARPDVLALVSPTCQSVLDVGCSSGALGQAIQRRQGARVDGIEHDERLVTAAAAVLARVIDVDLNDLDRVEASVGEAQYDCIICADVLEHLIDPWQTLRRLTGRLAPGGEVIISLPNVGHHNTLWNVFVRRRFPRRDRGLHDETHLRWFARHDIEALIAQANLQIRSMSRTYRLIERPSRANGLAQYIALPGLRDLLTYQFIVRATRTSV